MKRLAMVAAVLSVLATACGGGSDDGEATTTTSGSTGNVAAGAEVFALVCSTCHGPDAMGIEGLGKSLHDNEFVQSKTDDEMVAFINTGRPASDPLNTTGVDMPPRGGNPSLTDDDLYDVVAFVRTLQ